MANKSANTDSLLFASISNSPLDPPVCAVLHSTSIAVASQLPTASGLISKGQSPALPHCFSASRLAAAIVRQTRRSSPLISRVKVVWRRMAQTHTRTRANTCEHYAERHWTRCVDVKKDTHSHTRTHVYRMLIVLCGAAAREKSRAPRWARTHAIRAFRALLARILYVLFGFGHNVCAARALMLR